ncbi:hypothetical protein SAMN05216327_12343 [Dyadobacter sp. SG02]|uniref:response regulator transcription factor n=1 Tax=Dyadobacter sp. SG02 TaxID=1855291 RepID=UPI0008C044A2|nr:response regulator transcription factor [Dyadobacter sp. SG02]SEJ83934.1 hypothetical protein SAMN05216327_12343 [Dyadobacter sp. SG02]
MILLSLLTYVGGEGVHQVERTRQLFPGIPIIIYGSDPLPDSISMYYNAGINGYCSLESQDLIQCIKTVKEGKTYFTGSMVEYFVFQLQSSVRTAGARPLTSRQYQIAYYLAKGMSVTMIAKKLGLGHRLGISLNRVPTICYKAKQNWWTIGGGVEGSHIHRFAHRRLSPQLGGDYS